MAVLKELQHSAYKIARAAELPDGLGTDIISTEAKTILRNIDSFLYASQVELGQQALCMQPLALGAVMHEVYSQTRAELSQPIDLQPKVNAVVTSDPLFLQTLLLAVIDFMQKTSDGRFLLQTFNGKNDTVGIGVFSRGFNLSSDDLRFGLRHAGRATMPFARTNQTSGLSLVVANKIAVSLGTALKIKRLSGRVGLSLELPKSHQLTFI